MNTKPIAEVNYYSVDWKKKLILEWAELKLRCERLLKYISGTDLSTSNETLLLHQLEAMLAYRGILETRMAKYGIDTNNIIIDCDLEERWLLTVSYKESEREY